MAKLSLHVLRIFENWFPGVGRVRRLDLKGASGDAAAGVVLTVFLIPVGMAYANASGLPPVTGLYASIVPLLAYAVLGPSRRLILGPDSSLTPLIAASILGLGDGDPDKAIAIAGGLAIGTGILCMFGAVARFGFLTALLSAPIRLGYLSGIAVVVTISQLPVLLGLDVAAEDPLVTLADTVSQLDETNRTALAVGVFALVLSAASRRYARFPGMALAVAGSVAIVELGDLSGDVVTIGRLPSGLPAFGIPEIDGGDLLPLLVASASVALVAFADTGLLSKAYADRDRVPVDPNRELFAVGGANAATGLFQGFPISASSSRTPIAEELGARTQLASVVAALLIGVMLVAAPGLLQDLPAATLAGVVIVAVSGLIDFGAFVRLLRTRPREFVLGSVAFVGVIGLGVLWGIGLAIVLSLLAFIQRAWRPHTAPLVRVDGLKGYHDASRHPEGRQVPGLLLYRFDAPLFFANAALLKQEVLELVDVAEDPVRWVVISAEPITDIDATADEVLQDLYDRLEERNVVLGFAELKGTVRETIDVTGLADRIGSSHFHRTLGAAVRAYVDATGVDWVDWQDRDDPSPSSPAG